MILMHVFALFSALVSDLISKNLETIKLTDKILFQRISKILRLQIGDAFILFDSANHIRCRIISIAKDAVVIKVEDISKNIILTPKISWIMPLLKKEALEECLYSLTELGAQEIHPVITKKSQQSEAYLQSDRIKNIIISASEQSKQFVLPTLNKTTSLKQAILEYSKADYKIFFDFDGLNAFDVICDLKKQKAKNIVCIIGPEGDLTNDEKALLKENGFVFCKLTNTILRAKQAVPIGLGILRSMCD